MWWWTAVYAAGVPVTGWWLAWDADRWGERRPLEWAVVWPLVVALLVMLCGVGWIVRAERARRG